MTTDRFHLAGLIRVAAVLIPWVCAAQVPQYTISTVVGNANNVDASGFGVSGYSVDGTAATGAYLKAPYGVVLNSKGVFYFADQGNNMVRKIASDGTLDTVAGNGSAGLSGDTKVADDTNTEVNAPQGLLMDSSDNLYIADTRNCVIRRITSDNVIRTLVGKGSKCDFGGFTAAGTGSMINLPTSMALDSTLHLYIADTKNNMVRKLSPNSAGQLDTDSVLTIAAGKLQSGYDPAGDGGRATLTTLNNPQGVAVDTAGNLYIADTNNCLIRKVSTAGIITTIAGNGACPTGPIYLSGDGGSATKASLWYPASVAVDSSGRIFIADTKNNVIRVVTTDGIIQTVAGTSARFNAGYTGDGGLATNAKLNSPTSLYITSSGNIYFSDTANNVIRLLTLIPSQPVIYTGGVISASQFGASSSVAPGSWIEIYGSYLASAAQSWADSDFTYVNGVKTAPSKLSGTTVTIGGQPAYIDYVSPGQVNALVPSNVVTGHSQTVTVTTAVGTSSSVSVNVNDVQPGLLAPASFAYGGKPYVAAQFADGTWVGPIGAFPGFTTRPAKPGETIVIYGVGFGSVKEGITAGQIAPTTGTTLSSVAQFFFDGAESPSVPYYGLAPGYVGLYQFNVVVPTVAVGDAVSLAFKLGGVQGAQTLNIAIGN